MKQTIKYNDFLHAFREMGRGEQFSYDALKAIFEYIEDSECKDRAEEHQFVSDFLYENSGFVAETDKESYVFLQF